MSFFCFRVTLLNESVMWPFSFSTFRTLQIIFLFSFTKSLMFLILPGEISLIGMTPSLLNSSRVTNTVVGNIFFTVPMMISSFSGNSVFCGIFLFCFWS